MIGFSIEERAITLAHYIIYSKDTVNPALASEVRVILDENKAERHIRGGQATKLKYRNEHIRKEAI